MRLTLHVMIFLLAVTMVAPALATRATKATAWMPAKVRPERWTAAWPCCASPTTPARNIPTSSR